MMTKCLQNAATKIIASLGMTKFFQRLICRHCFVSFETALTSLTNIRTSSTGTEQICTVVEGEELTFRFVYGRYADNLGTRKCRLSRNYPYCPATAVCLFASVSLSCLANRTCCGGTIPPFCYCYWNCPTTALHHTTDTINIANTYNRYSRYSDSARYSYHENEYISIGLCVVCIGSDTQTIY